MHKTVFFVAIATILMTIGILVLSCDESTSESMCEIGCIDGSGYPCPCIPEEGCQSGAVCGAVSNQHEAGFCSIPCEKDEDCVWDRDCTGKRKCILLNKSSGNKTCALLCDSESDCPLNMSCIENDDLRLCYPFKY